MRILYVGIDLAKNVFAVHGVDEHGKAMLVRPSVARAKLHELIAALPPCIIGMEACSGSHHWARLFLQHGHTVRLMAPKFVAPYRLSGKQGKNDAADAMAICEAVQRPNMRFVPVKSQDEQARLCVHRVRQGLVEQRTATINRIRGLLSEFGIVLPQRAATVRREATVHLEDLPGWANTAIGDSLSDVHRLDERIAEYDHHVLQMARDDQRSRALMQLSGIGNTTASALVSTIGNAHDFKNGRHLAAWLGFVPGPYWPPPGPRSTGSAAGRSRLRSDVATGRQWSPSPPRTPAWPGRYWPKARTSSCSRPEHEPASEYRRRMTTKR